MYLHDHMDAGELNRLVAERYITTLLHPELPLRLYNYSDKAVYEQVWTPETRQCRGLIAETTTGRIVARPFDKFPNLDEPSFPEASMAMLTDRPPPIITDKLDGSMVAVWHYAGQWHASTRGNFASRQARAALGWLHTHADLDDLFKPVTWIGEWCAPDNRIVLAYREPRFTLLAARYIASGHEVPYRDLRDYLGPQLALPVVASYAGDLASAHAAATTLTGIEGWVAAWPDGMRAKIKTADYLALHRLVTGFSPARVAEAIQDGTWPSYVQALPEELRPEAERVAACIGSHLAVKTQVAWGTFERLAPLLRDSRKAFALAVQQEHPFLRPLLFALADARSIASLLHKQLDLAALFPDYYGGTDDRAPA